MWNYRYKRHLIDKKDSTLKELAKICEPVFINSVLSFNSVATCNGSIYSNSFAVRLLIYRGGEKEQTELYRFDICPEENDDIKWPKLANCQKSAFFHYCATISKRVITPFANKDSGKITASGDYKVGFMAVYGDMDIPSMDGIVAGFEPLDLEDKFKSQLEEAIVNTDFFKNR